MGLNWHFVQRHRWSDALIRNREVLCFSSLLYYGIHVQLVYGTTPRMWRQQWPCSFWFCRFFFGIRRWYSFGVQPAFALTLCLVAPNQKLSPGIRHFDAKNQRWGLVLFVSVRIFFASTNACATSHTRNAVTMNEYEAQRHPWPGDFFKNSRL